MKRFLTIVLSFCLLHARAQVFQRIILPSASPSGFDSALVSLPNDYNTTTGLYPVIVFCHGKGEAADGTTAGIGLAKIINSKGSGGPIWYIAQGTFPTSFVNPKDGKTYKFIVVAPQENTWGPSPASLALILPALLSKYRIDPTRVCLTGVSAGGQGLSQYAGHYLAAPTVPVADIVPMSAAIDAGDIPGVAKNIAADGVHMWAFGDPINDLWGGNTQVMEQTVAKVNAALAQFTQFSTGHGPWNPFYDPKFTVNGMNIYQWMLQFTSSGAVTVPIPPIVVPPVTVPPAPTGPRKPVRWIMSPNQDSGWVVTAPPYQPDDTLDFPARYGWTYKELDNYSGQPNHPLIITNSGGVTTGNDGITLKNCTYVKVTGSGTPGIKYGFFLTNPTPKLRTQSPFAVVITGRSKCIEVERVDMHNVGIGYAIKTDNNCDQTQDYPNWQMDSIVVHDGRVVGIWNEGMYWGNTSPDNASYDPRADQCDVTQPSPAYSLPMKIGYSHIYNMIIDSTGRGGIQAVANFVEINNCSIKHSGLNGDDAQGVGISVGLYTQAYIHDDTVINTLTMGIGSIGGCGTNKRSRIINNFVDSSGFLFNYPRLANTPDESFDPAKEQASMDTFTYPYAIWMATRRRIYTQASGGTAQAPPGAPYGTAVKGQDSTLFTIAGNTIGHFRCFTSAKDNQSAIQIEDDFPGMQVNGDSICNNTSSLGQPINIFTGRVTHPINIVTCGSAPPVVVPPACPVCPVCPVVPPARGIKSWTIVTVNGVGRIQVTFTDDVTQLLP